MKPTQFIQQLALFSSLLAAAVAGAETVVPLNTLDLSVVRQGWGSVQTNRSVDGNPLSIGGKKFERGVGTHAESTFPITLDGKGTRFNAQVGVDDEVGSEGTIVFQVLGDGKILWQSGEMHGGDAPKSVDIKLDGVNKLTLLVQDAGDDINYDHADWADARIVMAEGAPMTATASPASAAASTASSPSASTSASNEVAIILTPRPSASPRINNAKVFGVRPGNPFLFTIAATGERPMTFSADGLPSGLQLDAKTGRITGVLKEKGEYAVTLHAKNARGAAEQKFKIVCGPQIGLTPALGWNSWNVFGRSVSDALARTAADAMVKETPYGRLIDHGWTYINLDDGWERSPRESDPLYEGPTRDPQTGKFLTNKKFPDMKALGDYIHGLGLKFGIYSGPGPRTCQGLEASYQHELIDAQTWAEWGVDYLKYDWCSYGEIASREALARLGTNVAQSASSTNAAGRRGRGPRVPLTHEDHIKPYRIMGEVLPKVPRDIIYSLCQYGNDNVWEWGAEVGGNSWRTTGDITDTWRSLSSIGFRQGGHEKYVGPGHFDDPDMLIVGHVGWGPRVRPTRLTPNEAYTHISLWCLLASPLLIGCDMAQLDEFTLNLLCNDEVLAVDQDPLGRQASRISQDQEKQIEVWSKLMEDGSRAVGLFNRGEADAAVPVNWTDLGISGQQTVRDLWRQKDLGQFEARFEAPVPRHGVVLVKITPGR